MAKQLGLNEILWDSGHVEGDKGRFNARAMAMQRVGNQLFTGSGLAVDQYANRRAGEAANDAKHILHGGRFADDVRGRAKILHVTRLLLLLIVADGSLNQRHRLVDIERFRQVIKCSLLVGADGRIEIGVRGHNDDREHGMPLFNLLQQCQTVHARHADIRQQHVRGFSGQRIEHLIPTLKRCTTQAGTGKGAFKHPADGTIVINNPCYPSLHHRHLYFLIGR